MVLSKQAYRVYWSALDLGFECEIGSIPCTKRPRFGIRVPWLALASECCGDTLRICLLADGQGEYVPGKMYTGKPAGHVETERERGSTP